MKEQLWNLAFYAIIFGLVYYQYYAEGDWWLTIAVTIIVIGFVNIGATVLTILWYGLVWFWNASVNFRKDNNDRRRDT